MEKAAGKRDPKPWKRQQGREQKGSERNVEKQAWCRYECKNGNLGWKGGRGGGPCLEELSEAGGYVDGAASV
jgi:hypothetical protein